MTSWMVLLLLGVLGEASASPAHGMSDTSPAVEAPAAAETAAEQTAAKGGAPRAGGQAAQDEEAPRAVVSEEVTVTAQKRSEALVEVPISVQALEEEELVRRQTQGVEELVGLVPNLDYAEFADGQYRMMYRGIGASGTSSNQTFNTAIDTVIVPYNRAFRLFDLESVEVLRGPQGTIFGRNSVAGVINVITRTGSSGSPAHMTVSGGTKDTAAFRGAFGGPAGDSSFFYRLAGRYYETDGFFRNPGLDTEDSAEERNWSGRGTLGWSNDEDLILHLAVTVDDYDNNADNQTVFRLDPPRQSRAPFLSTSDGSLLLSKLHVDKTFDDFLLTSITAYSDAERHLDLSTVISPVFFFQDDVYETYSEELRFSSLRPGLGGKVDWLAGVFLMREENDFGNLFTLFKTVPLSNPVQTRTTETGALFGQLDATLSEHWQLTAGLRVAQEDQEAEARRNALSDSELILVSDDYTSVLPKVVLSYFPEAGKHLYASITKGFRSGFFFINNPEDPFVEPEDTWQFELGYKSLLTSNLRLSTAAFYIDWTDLQVQRALALVSTVVDNAAEARSWGGEIDLDWRAADGLRVGFRGGYTDAKYTEFEPTPGVSLDGNWLEYVPSYSVGTDIWYTLASGFFVGGDVTASEGRWLDNANTERDGSYVLVNAQVGYGWERYRLALLGHNLLDEDWVTRGVTAPGFPFLVQYTDPLSASVELSIDF